MPTTGNPKLTQVFDWPSFLHEHDLVWEKLPAVWMDAPFLGNGMMGTIVRQIGQQSLRWDVGRGDVQDHRVGEAFPAKCGQMFNTCRLPIGWFELQTVGTISRGTMRLDLWSAELTGTVDTDQGRIRFRTIVHADEMLILTELDPDEGEAGCRWVWHGEPAVSPRHLMKPMDEYVPNPPATEEQEGETNLCVQPLLCGGETATGWKEVEQPTANTQHPTPNTAIQKRVLLVSVAHKFPAGDAREEVVCLLDRCGRAGAESLIQSHRKWWNGYYPKSFVSIPDAGWESYYWIQMYKLGSATRSDRMLIDNQGPWLQPTPWPGAWWDLNVQLTYWPTYTSNRLELAQSLTRTLYGNAENLINNVEPEYRHDSAAIGCATGQDCIGPELPPDGERNVMMGLLLWALHNCWLHYRRTMDDTVLRDNLFPLLKRAISYYFHFITEGEDGVLHLPPTWSPEFKTRPGLEIPVGPDCNFDLALFRWGCQTLIESCNRLGLEDPLLPKWQDTLTLLAPYPCDENGFMIGAGIPFNTKHRHYSHLLMAYPLYLVNADQDGSEALVMKSVRHWQSYGASHGYACTGASSLSSAFGYGNDALMYLENLKEHISCTTMYAEHVCWPVIETPLSGAQAIHDMLLQSWGDIIRIFPAMPDAWEDAAFHDLLAEGAFLVSASRKHGETQWVRIKSLAGERCLVCHGLSGEVMIQSSRQLDMTEHAAGVLDIPLNRGEEALLWSGEYRPEFLIRPVGNRYGQPNSFGLKSKAHEHS